MSRKNSLLLQLILLVLIFIAALGFTLNVFLGKEFGRRSNDFMNNTGDDIQTTTFTGISKFDIDSVSYPIQVIEHSGSEVIVETDISKNGIGISVAEDKLYSEGDTVYFKTGATIGIFVFNKGSITIKVPKDSKYTYNLHTVSGSVSLDANCKNANINSTSGSIKVYGTGDKLSANSVSGSIKFFNPFNTVDAESTSGSIKVVANSSSKDFYLNSTSGSVAIALQDNVGYDLDYSSVSGSVKDEYQNISYSKKGSATQGDGQLKITAKTTSGSIKLTDWD